MGTINVGRVLLGGLLAGLVMNISESLLNGVVMASDVEAAMQSLNRPPVGGGAIAKLVLLTFGLGIATVWLYAAIRPRFGVGTKTALIAGLAVWLFAYFYGAVVGSVTGVFPLRLYVIATGWELLATLLAALAGAWLYKEA